MKLWFFSLLILFGIMTSKVWASSQTDCQLTTGIYQNSQINMSKFYFFSYADLFTLSNAKSLFLQIDGQEIHFQRTDIVSKKSTQLIYVGKVNGKYRKAFVLIDRSPKEVLNSKMFIGNMILSTENTTSDFTLVNVLQSKNAQTFNFSCKF